jgi:hypothetical protein
MIELLKDKLLNYSLDKSQKFYSSFPISDHDGMMPEYPLSTWGFPDNHLGYSYWVNAIHNRGTQPYIMWEKHSDGFIFWTSLTAVFFKDNGRIYKLTSTHLSHDWQMHNELYNLNLEKKLIRMEAPLHGEKINLLGKDYWYTIVYRENYQNLINVHELHITGKVNKRFLLNAVDESTKMLELTKEINDKFNLGCPSLGTAIIKIFFDNSDNFGGIWTDFKHWNKTFEEYLTFSYSSLLHYLDDHKNDDIISNDDAREILTYCVNEWKIFGVAEDVFRAIEYEGHNIDICPARSKVERLFEGTQIKL